MDTDKPKWDESPWWKSKQDVSRACRVIFDLQLGGEGNLFSRYMDLLRVIFDDPILQRISTPSQKVALAMAGQAYQSLISVWQELSEGRLASASAHWRSLAEAPDYIMASALNEEHARSWADPERRETLSVAKAQAIVKRAMNEMGKGLGDKWLEQRRDDLQGLSAFSHVSSEIAGFAVLRVSSAKGYFVTPEGRYADDIKAASIYAVLLARDVVGACAIAFKGALPDEWQNEAGKWFREGLSELTREYGKTYGTVSAEQ